MSAILGCLTCMGFYLWYRSTLGKYQGSVTFGEPEWESDEPKTFSGKDLSGE